MNGSDFRRIALSMPEAEEKSHFDQPDYRVRGKIFATMDPGETRGMVSPTPEEQEMLVGAAPTMFRPVPGSWGAKGSTHVLLEAADETTVRSAMTMAWKRRAGPKMLKRLELS